jgi:hypothetical protein
MMQLKNPDELCNYLGSVVWWQVRKQRELVQISTLVDFSKGKR